MLEVEGASYPGAHGPLLIVVIVVAVFLLVAFLWFIIYWLRNHRN